MAEKRILIIGAGIAGLAAGCYARMNGYDVQILEQHTLPGGLCMSWKRKDYIFDGCIHYLFGTAPGNSFYRMWEELGAIQGRTMISHTEYQHITDGQRTLIVYADPDQLEAHMLELSPQDAGPIKALCRGIRHFQTFDLGVLYDRPRNLMTGNEWRRFGMKMMPFLPAMLRWGISAKQFAQRFRDPFLRRAVPQMFSWEDAPVMMGMMLLAYQHTGNAAYPQGGSLEFAQAIEKRFLALGGRVEYNAQVERILTRDGRAAGVRLYDDREIEADYVISAADGRRTIFHLLDGEYADAKVRRMYDGHLPMHTQVQVSLGVKRDMREHPHWTTYLLDKPMTLIGDPRSEIGVKHYSFDPTLAPEGKSVVQVMMRSDYHYWDNIHGRRLYDTEQRQVTDLLLARIEAWHPGITADVEFKDEATPLTYERFTGNWQGATCGWLLTPETMRMLIFGVKRTLPGLKNFWMAGQWVEPGGSVPMAAASGRTAIQLICAQEGKPFTATVPSGTPPVYAPADTEAVHA
ncbi:MAG: NAD(P)/FAD-dependent oxidoreductase [Chloroflexi bacterium]|nr:NAD(P)/FAD-dependent oxidoreductase [Chloroflexota bacterium]